MASECGLKYTLPYFKITFIKRKFLFIQKTLGYLEFFLQIWKEIFLNYMGEAPWFLTKLINYNSKDPKNNIYEKPNK